MMTEKEIEERTAASIAKSRLYTAEKFSVVTRLTYEAQISVFQSAPSEVPKLNVQIALKTKAYHLEKDRRKNPYPPC
jgi:hypothetical protein